MDTRQQRTITVSVSEETAHQLDYLAEWFRPPDARRTANRSAAFREAIRLAYAIVSNPAVRQLAQIVTEATHAE